MVKKILEIVAALGAVTDIDNARLVALEMIRQVIWFDRGNFFLYHPFLGVPQGPPVSLDFTMDNYSFYMQHFAHADELLQAYRISNILIARSTDLMPYHEWTRKSKYYNEMLKPLNIHYSVIFEIKDGQMVLGGMCLFRSINNGDFNQEDINMLHLLYPHLVNRLRWHFFLSSVNNTFQPFAQNKLNNMTFLFNRLTERERNVACKVVLGCSNLEIATSLGISINTVKMHLQNIFAKLDIKRRSQLIMLYNFVNQHPVK